jgi:Bacterial Ig domain
LKDKQDIPQLLPILQLNNPQERFMRTRPLVNPPFSVARLWVAFFLLIVLFSASTAHATTATMVSPAAGGTVSGTISISASISPNSGYASVVFWVDNWTQIGSSSSPHLTYNSTALSNGSHNFFVTVLDSAGNTLCASNIVSATVRNNTTATMVSPSNGSNISGTINFSVSVNAPNGYASIAFWVDNWTRVGTNSSPSLSYNTTALSNGNHNFFVTVLDSSGNALAASNIVTANVQNSSIPVLSMTSPTGGTVSGAITVSTSANTSVSSVTFYNDSWSNPIGTVSSTPYQMSFNTAILGNGNHTFWATAQNTAGSGASNIVTVNVQNSNPSPSCTPIAAKASVDQNGFDMLAAFNNTNTGATGPYFGAGNWTSSWYFLNIAYLGYVDLMPSTVKGYIGYYLSHTNADWSIDTNPDSDDSFAATQLSLAAAYYRVTCDQAFFSTAVSGKNVTVLQALKNIATNNLVNAAFPNGLVHVFQQASQFPIAYDEDNSEDYKGLEDFGNFLNSIGDSSASTYLNAAAKIASGMQQTYTNNVYNGTTTNHNYLNLPGFLNAWQEDSGFTGPLPMSNPSPTFYPDGASQIFPQAYRVPVPSSMYSGGWTFLRSTFDFESPSVSSSDPWTIIGLAATYNGDNNTANAMLSKTRNWGGPPINDWSFYRRIVLYQMYGFVY